MASNGHLSKEELERTKRVLESSDSITQAARTLGISRRAMQYRIKRNLKFSSPVLPSKSRDIDQLIKDKIEESRRAKTADEARDLIHIPVHIDGPFAVLVLGDPHVDDAGCDFELLASHRQLAIDHPYILAASVGDYQNGWIGRLGVLYGEQQVTAREAWKLVEWLVSPLQWLFLIAGNHDLWQGQGDPLEWIAHQAGSLILVAFHDCASFLLSHISGAGGAECGLVDMHYSATVVRFALIIDARLNKRTAIFAMRRDGSKRFQRRHQFLNRVGGFIYIQNAYP
jgi:hypothetical protein